MLNKRAIVFGVLVCLMLFVFAAPIIASEEGEEVTGRVMYWYLDEPVIEGSVVRLVDPEEEIVEVEAVTDEEGYFNLKAVPEGAWELQVVIFGEVAREKEVEVGSEALDLGIVEVVPEFGTARIKDMERTEAWDGRFFDDYEWPIDLINTSRPANGTVLYTPHCDPEDENQSIWGAEFHVVDGVVVDIQPANQEPVLGIPEEGYVISTSYGGVPRLTVAGLLEVGETEIVLEDLKMPVPGDIEEQTEEFKAWAEEGEVREEHGLSHENIWEYPDDIADLLRDPPGENIVHLGYEGLEPGDEIDSYLEEYVQDNTRVYIPEGTYKLASQQSFTDIENASIIGEGEVIFDRGDEHEARIILYPDGDFQMRNIELKGVGAAHNSTAIVTGTTNPFATIVLYNINIPDGSVQARSQGMFVHRTHAGKLYVVDVSIKGFADNGLYGSAPGLEGNGEVHVYGGVYRNNNITNIRIGSHNSSIRNAVSIHDDYAPPYVGQDSPTQRGIWIWPARNILIEDTDIKQTVNGVPIVLGMGEGSGTIRNSRIFTTIDNAAISVGAGQDWDGDNLDFAGGGNYLVDTRTAEIFGTQNILDMRLW